MFFRDLQRRASGGVLAAGFLLVATISMSACSSSTSTAGAATATSGVATATPASSGTVCAGLDAIFQAAQAQKTIGFNMSAQPGRVVHGSLTTYTPGASDSLSGSGFLVSPNDMVTIQLTRAAPAVTLTITDTVAAQATTYTVSACAATSSTILTLTGTTPTSFTASLSTTPS